MISNSHNLGRLQLLELKKRYVYLQAEENVMKSEFRTKLLPHQIDMKNSVGLALIESLMPVVIIGALSAIALPSFLNQANQAKQAEAKAYIAAMNQAQQNYYSKHGGFSHDLGQLGLSIKSVTNNYGYSIEKNNTIETNVAGNAITHFAVPQSTAWKTYIGGVVAVEPTATSTATTVTILCESDKPGVDVIPPIFSSTAAPACPANWTKLD